jgi:hypothetical protein
LSFCVGSVAFVLGFQLLTTNLENVYVLCCGSACVELQAF